MSTEARAKDLSSAFLRMSTPTDKAGAFTTAAVLAGYGDSLEGRRAFAGQVAANPERWSKDEQAKADFHLSALDLPGM